MKYVLYIDYRATCAPLSTDYIPLQAKNIADAIIEADAAYDSKTMYLIHVMVKSGKKEKVDSNIKAQTYKSIMEKRSTKWTNVNMEHSVKHYMAKFYDWYDIA